MKSNMIKNMISGTDSMIWDIFVSISNLTIGNILSNMWYIVNIKLVQQT